MELSLNKVNPLYLLVGVLAMLAVSLGFSNSAAAHGYVESPESRSFLCSEGANNNCSGIEYEPQSVEGPGDFPEAGVPDGKIAGGGSFETLNDQSANRWAKVAMSSGANQFTWKLTAAHSTSHWEYYITKEGWDVNSPLKRSDLESFCYIDDGGARPDFSVTHNCDVPERDGYHVILAYWEIGDTGNAFYQVIDANFDGEYVEPEEPVDPEEPEVPVEPSDAYDSSAVYLGGDQVTHNGNTYEAKWWTQGQEPGTNSVWVLVSEGDVDPEEPVEPPVDPEEPEVPVEPSNAYDSSAVYLGGDQVTLNGNTYEAAWWTQGQEPGTNAVWILVSGDNGNDNGEEPTGDAFSSSSVYVGGDVVSHNGQTYKAAWWTLGETPGNSSVWVVQ